MIAACGTIVACRAQALEARLPAGKLGARVRVETCRGVVWTTVAALEGARATLIPLDDHRSAACGDRAILEEGAGGAVVGTALLGRAIDGTGSPLDGGEPPSGVAFAQGLDAPTLGERRLPAVPLWTGLRALDGLLTLGRGGRIGVFGPPGTGKSLLLERIARDADADAVVIAAIGERGSEAYRRLLALDARTTLVCASSDRTAGERIAAGELGFAHAERLRAYGLDVLLVFDSLARYAQAGREIALGCGEAPGRGGYPPSVLARLAKLVERAGATESGSITLVASVLTEADDPADPLAEAARSLLDGHVLLSRAAADAGRFPAIDPVRSLSRTMLQVVDAGHAAAATRVRAALGRLEESRDARAVGITAPDPAEPAIEAFLRQGEEISAAEETLRSLEALADTV
ncbi:MAG: hypothetical protein JO359_12875 [Candidatus Eremiobacteraeota bacterium]|nr:hypothetical protein [Candidatus Eremiobacteraeota bacterium]